MKSFEQLARSAFAAYKNKRFTPGPSDQDVTWDDLDAHTREAWVEVARSVVTEMATVH